jgi:hypothetical protein
VKNWASIAAGSGFAVLMGWDLWEAMGIGAGVPWILLWLGGLLPVTAVVLSLILWRSLSGVAERLAIMVVA